jgi:subtilase family serine protease
MVVSQESITRTNLTVRGSVSQFQTLFKTQFNTYRATDGQTFYSASIKPAVPAEIASKVSGVIGLTAGKPLAQQSKIAKVLGENPTVRSDKMRADTAGGTGPGGTYSCADLRQIYGIPNWGVLEKGMIVAVFEQGYYRPSDVEKYVRKFGLGKGAKQTAFSVDQSPIDLEPAVEAEDVLDIDMLVGMNPEIAEVKVFIDDYQYDPFSVAMVDAFQAIADDGTPQIVSVSYGEDEGYFGSDAENAENTVLQQLAIEGITVLASSGDGGAFGDGYNYPYNVSEPSSNPYVTGVGGTSLFTGPHEAYYGETAWIGTGGGISSFWSLPVYQFRVVPNVNNEASQTYRNVPDVGAVGDPLTGVGIYVKDDGGWIQIGGTSLSCPVWAGFLSTVNAALNWSGIGNLSKKTVIAVFEQGGYKISDTDVYFETNKLRKVKQTSIAVDSSPIQVELSVEVEACLDIDTVVGINPDVAEVLVYIDDYNTDPFNVAMPAAITAVANDNKAQILSISYGQNEGYQGNSAMEAENTALQQCAAEGITVLASSGDGGAYEDWSPYYPYNVLDPASQPNVTGVGGTTLYTGPGEIYVSEQAWNDLGNAGVATGGGISSYWAIPTYQIIESLPGYTTVNGGSSTMRNVPDVGAVADPRTGVGVYVKDQGGWVQVGGTSLSCPVWAGYLSTIDAAFTYAGIGNLGLFNAGLYAIGSPYFYEGFFPYDWLYNVTDGSNGNVLVDGHPGYTNGPGYSNTTGNGSIWGGGLAAQILISQTQPGTPPRTFWFNTPKVTRKSIEVTWANSNGSAAYVMALYFQSPGGTIVQTFVTKETKLTIDGLLPNTTYNLWGWSFNASGYYAIPYPIQFQTAP